MPAPLLEFDPPEAWLHPLGQLWNPGHWQARAACACQQPPDAGVPHWEPLLLLLLEGEA